MCGEKNAQQTHNCKKKFNWYLFARDPRKGLGGLENEFMNGTNLCFREKLENCIAKQHFQLMLLFDNIHTYLICSFTLAVLD